MTDCQRLYNSRFWRRTRASVLAERPVCVFCGDRLAREVHHIDGDCLNNAPHNLEPLCSPCHREVTRRNRRAFGHG